jgi:hypothetical protein
MTETTTTQATDKVFDPCGKCMGDGVVHYGNVVYTTRRGPERTCHRCNGAKGRWTTQAAIDKRERARARRAEKANIEAASKLAEAEAKLNARRAEFEADHGDVIEFLPSLTGDFGSSLREALESHGNLTEKQVEAVRKIKAQRDAEPTPVPVVEGRIQITGRVVTEKWVDSDYGTTHKMLVLDDRGFKVWGTVPQAVEPENYYDEHGEYQHEHGVGCGGRDSNHAAEVRVTFTATVEASRDDETFGFYKRPTKAEKL